MELNAEAVGRLASWLAAALGAAAVRVLGSERLLGGGAIQENWALDLELEGGPRDGQACAGAAHRRALAAWP